MFHQDFSYKAVCAQEKLDIGCQQAEAYIISCTRYLQCHYLFYLKTIKKNNNGSEKDKSLKGVVERVCV